MNLKTISSEQNPVIKQARKLATSNRFCKLSGRTLAEGIHLAGELIGFKELIESIYLLKGLRNSEINKIVESLGSLDVDAYELPPALFKHICPVDSSTGIICEIHVPPKYHEPVKGDVVFLDGVQDPGNLGTILRTCVAAGVTNVALSKDCAFTWSPKALRAGMGAQFALKIMESTDIVEIKTVTGNQCLVTALQGGKDLFSEPWGDKPTIWVFGSEGQGVSKKALAAADKILYIPISSKTESLNVAAASAVCLFEQKRRRLPSTTYP